MLSTSLPSKRLGAEIFGSEGEVYGKVIPENAKLSIIVPLAIAVGVMLSSESLLVLGNGMGRAGALFLALLFLAVAAHFFALLSYKEVFGLDPGRQGNTS